MPTIVDHAICIRVWDFSETSQTVSVLTRGHGIIRGLAKGAKREKGAFSGGFDILAQGEVVASLKPGRDLALLTAWHLHNMHRVLRERLCANRAGLYMADLVHHLLVEHDPHPAVFEALVSALQEMSDDASQSNCERVLLRFQWAMLNETGYQPELQRDAKSGVQLPSEAATLVFSAAAGGVVAEAEQASGAAWRVRRETVELLRRLASGTPLSGADDESVRRANRLLAVYAREIIGSEPPAMRWAFSDLGGPATR